MQVDTQTEKEPKRPTVTHKDRQRARQEYMQVDTQTEKEPKRPTVTQKDKTDRERDRHTCRQIHRQRKSPRDRQ